MTGIEFKRVLGLVLWGVSGVLGLLLLLEVSMVRSVEPETAQPQGDGAGLEIDSIRIGKQPPLEAYVEVWSRPLFVRNRRPPAAEKASEAKSGFLDVELLAVVEFGHKREAYVRSEGKQEPQWLKEGDQLSEWRLSTIGIDRVYFRNEDTVVRVMLMQWNEDRSEASRPTVRVYAVARSSDTVTRDAESVSMK